MGAVDFTASAAGKTVEEAFAAATEQARYDYGHAGYTGTIAEKHSFTVIERTPQDPAAAAELAWKLIDDDDPRIHNKWGPAGAIAVTENRWLFFGFASS
ncbi:hypothetical protein ACWEQ4_00805 [Rhodococcus sp. NPDC003994]